MLLAVILSVFGLAFFVQPKGGGRGIHLTVLILVAALLGMTLYTINDLDSPFGGLNKIAPTEMTRTVAGMEGDFAKAYPGASIPCKPDGSPV